MKEADAERLAAGLLIVGFEGTVVPPAVEDLVRRGVRAFVLFSRNVKDEVQLLGLTSRLQELCEGEAHICIDQEGGLVTRLRDVCPEWPSQMAVAATQDEALGEKAAFAVGSVLHRLGLTWNLAPVADVLQDAMNPALGTRAFSDDSVTAARFTAAMVRGYQRSGVAACAKHFPGHGGTAVDSHVALPEVRSTLPRLRAIDLPPFRAATETDVRSLMASHVWYTALDDAPLPATLSPAAIGIARHELGFEGAIVTDCMEMAAMDAFSSEGAEAVRAVIAGCDGVAYSRSISRQRSALVALKEALLAGLISSLRAMEAQRRLDCVRVAPKSGETSEASSVGPDDVARAAVTLVRGDNNVLPLRGDKEVVVVSFPARRASGVVDDPGRSALAAALQRCGLRAREIALKDETALAAMESLNRDSTVVVALSDATHSTVQRAVVRRIVDRHQRVIAIALRDPYDIRAYPEVQCVLTAYGDVAADLDALARVIAGQDAPTGRLPVRLSTEA